MDKEKHIWKTIKDFAFDEKKSVVTIYNWIESGKISKDRVKKVLSTTLIRM